jgi:hypothetical protein
MHAYPDRQCSFYATAIKYARCRQYRQEQGFGMEPASFAGPRDSGIAGDDY